MSSINKSLEDGKINGSPFETPIGNNLPILRIVLCTCQTIRCALLLIRIIERIPEEICSLQLQCAIRDMHLKGCIK